MINLTRKKPPAKIGLPEKQTRLEEVFSMENDNDFKPNCQAVQKMGVICFL